MKTIKYIPTTELILFIAVCGLSITFYLAIGFHLGILVCIVLFAYVFIAAGINFIRVDKREIKITYWYLIFWTETISIKDIIKIESQQTFEEESVYVDSIYHLLKRKYQIQFKDKKNRVKKLEFKIGNRMKEAEIVSAIKNGCQQKFQS